MFVRTKKIKRYHYAYLVENTWKKKSSRQKVSKYLGRVYEFSDISQHSPIPLDDMDYPESVVRLISLHLKQIGFVEVENETGTVLAKDNLGFSADTLSFSHLKTGKPVVLKSFDGYLCNHTIKQLSDFKKTGDEEQTGYALAKACIAAGLNIPKESFVELFEKISPVRQTLSV